MIKLYQIGLTIFSFFLFIKFSYAQQQTVTGKVLGKDCFLYKATISAGHVTALTDSTGNFFLTLNPGIYYLQISHSGYKEISQEIKVEEGQNLSLQFNMIPDEIEEEVIIVASRLHARRSYLSTPVPVDVISSKQLLQTGQSSLTQMLQYALPSFNASRQLVNEPVTLRGLDPDQVLILVNGIRYHNMSFVNWGGVRGMLGRGAVSNDLNSIPFAAIEKIEILRDGATAQYGSDAIAGVINIQLKKNIGKTWSQIHAGQFYYGDGETVNVGINQGISFFKKGFLNFSAVYRYQNPTYRGGEYRGTVYTGNVKEDDSIVKVRKFNRNNVSNAGSSKHNGYGISVNGGFPLDDKTELFWSAIADIRTSIFTSGYILPKNFRLINYEIYPDGFKANPENHVLDISAIAGVKGETTKHWQWQYSIAYGNNAGKYFNNQTNNASQFYTLGKSAPTSFYTGSLVYGQLVNDIHVSKNISIQSDRTLKLGAGTEWRLEQYNIKNGEKASWTNYNPAGNKLGGSGGLVLSPYDAISEKRSVTAAYVEMELEKKRFLIDLAGRYEYYTDFGGNLAGKLAARYKLNQKFSLRSSISNGFRAPSLQQRYMSFTRINPVLLNGVLIFSTQGIFRNNSAVANVFGIPSLQGERSVNISSGVTSALSQNIRFTMDAFWIQIKNRIVLSGVFDRSVNSDVNTLLNGMTDVTQVQFFTNAISTRTKGVDIMFEGSYKVKNADLSIILGANFTQTKLFGKIKKAGTLKADSLNSNTLFSIEERIRMEEGQPADKIILSLFYRIGKTKLTIRNTRFGKTAFAPAYTDRVTRSTIFLYESFSPKILTDISLGYSPKKWFTVSIGANNIFNVYPDRLKDYRNSGEGIYIYGQEATPFGFNGGYYFISMEINRNK